jgi:nucleoside-diphosphate kinase
VLTVKLPLFKVWQGKGVVKGGRTLIGATDPANSAPGTIRGDFGIEIGRNIIHGSDSVENGAKEIALWFDERELCDWKPTHNTHIYE